MLKGKYLLSSSPEGAVVTDLRKRIPEFGTGSDENDTMAFYALVYDENDEPSACGRLYIDESNHFRIDTVGVLPEKRRQYMGDLVARMLLYKSEELNAPRIDALVQKKLIYFFARYGFKSVAERGGQMEMSVDQAAIRLEGSCSKGDGSACTGDCDNCK